MVVMSSGVGGVMVVRIKMVERTSVKVEKNSNKRVRGVFLCGVSCYEEDG